MFQRGPSLRMFGTLHIHRCVLAVTTETGRRRHPRRLLDAKFNRPPADRRAARGFSPQGPVAHRRKPSARLSERRISPGEDGEQIGSCWSTSLYGCGWCCECVFLCVCGCTALPSCVFLHLLDGYICECTLVCVCVCVCVYECTPHTYDCLRLPQEPQRHVLLELEGNLSQGSLCGGQAG